MGRISNVVRGSTRNATVFLRRGCLGVVFACAALAGSVAQASGNSGFVAIAGPTDLTPAAVSTTVFGIIEPWMGGIITASVILGGVAVLSRVIRRRGPRAVS